MWDDLWTDSYHHFALVQETEIAGLRYQRYRIGAGRNSHPDCLQPLGRSYWVRHGDDIVCIPNMTNESPQFQMDDTSYCLNYILHAGDCKLGNDLCHVDVARIHLRAPTSRL